MRKGRTRSGVALHHPLRPRRERREARPKALLDVPADHGSMQAALDAASHGDAIVVAVACITNASTFAATPSRASRSEVGRGGIEPPTRRFSEIEKDGEK
jgi:hypothetical protein